MIPVMLGVLIIVFTISYLAPGDPVTAMLGTSYTAEAHASLSHELGLDKPFIEQLWSYFWNLISHFNMGISYSTKISVSSELAARFPVTVKIGLLSIAAMLVAGVPLGILSAIKQYSVLDVSLTTAALVFAAIPSFVLALLGIILFGVKLGWLPITGLKTWQAWVMPVCANSLAGVAVIIRMTRTTMLEVVRQDYIRTARSKGFAEGVVIRRHALKNCLIPITTVIGAQMAVVLAGSIIVETIFAIPGMGMYMMSGLSSRDYPVINGTVLILSLTVCVLNLLIDIAYALIDPRIKAQYITPKKKAQARLKPIQDNAEVA
jgi:peptide/nickel transport system permease protein